ncbi:MAG: GNAT family N-acetyltransferase [Clostridia bacterium]|nr:GNAT family N-acetyltransferase [Clostridia bacterium]
MIYRTVSEDEAERFFEMLCRLDEETDYMMYEPGERRKTSNGAERLRSNIREAGKGDFLLVAEDAGVIAGFIWAQRGKPERVRHSAYIVAGVLASYRGRGIGSEFFRLLDDWARDAGIIRLELTVESSNTAAKRLYEKCGFAVEGVRRASMKVGGDFVDEYYMGKILD